MRIRIQQLKFMRIPADPDPKPWNRLRLQNWMWILDPDPGFRDRWNFIAEKEILIFG